MGFFSPFKVTTRTVNVSWNRKKANKKHRPRVEYFIIFLLFTARLNALRKTLATHRFVGLLCTYLFAFEPPPSDFLCFLLVSLFRFAHNRVNLYCYRPCLSVSPPFHPPIHTHTHTVSLRCGLYVTCRNTYGGGIPTAVP